MNLAAVGACSAASLQPTAASVPLAQREAWNDLRRALRTDDLSAAGDAYASIIKNAPEGATFPRGSAFADLGKALIAGDSGAAKEAFRTMQLARLNSIPSEPLPPIPLPSTNEAGGGIDLYA
jgi:hypothetical protein